MILILFRHGHKAMDPPENPSLSARGFEQAEQLLEMVKKNILPPPTVCLFTDKIRTEQTFKQLIDFYKPKTEIKADLYLRSHLETSAQFRARVQKLVNYYTFQAAQPENKNQVIYLCTHYDWIEEAMSVINSDKNLNSFEFASWSPAQFIEFEINDNQWIFKSKGVANASYS